MQIKEKTFSRMFGFYDYHELYNDFIIQYHLAYTLLWGHVSQYKFWQRKLNLPEKDADFLK